MTSLPHLYAAAGEHTRELPMPPIAFGALAFVGFLFLLGVLWSFRGTASKIAGGTPTVRPSQADHVGDPQRAAHH